MKNPDFLGIRSGFAAYRARPTRSLSPMQPMQLLAASITIALAALVALPVAALSQATGTDTRAQDLLRRVLAAVATQPLVNAAFVERRSSALFAQPLESRGTLSFKPQGVIEKQTTHPIRETVTIAAETLTVDVGNGAPPQVFRLDTQSTHMASYVQGLRAILGGDDKLLGQVFDTRPAGSFDSWRVTLLPKGPPPRRGIRQIVVTGNAGHVQQIETTEVNGDIQLMMITTR